MGYSITDTLRKALARLIPPVATGAGLVSAADERGIRDGLHYAMPVLLPEYLREHLEETGRLDAYLKESAADTYRFQFDTPYRTAADSPINPTTEDPLLEWNWATRKMVLSNCHAVYQRNPLANTAVQLTANFCIGKGVNITLRNKEVERVIQDFMTNPDNAMREYERQAFIDLQVDGELFGRYFEGEGETAGQVVFLPLRPWECQFIETEQGFFRRPTRYRFQFYRTQGDSWEGGWSTSIEDIEARDVLHVGINRHAYELRGRPELYRVLPYLRAEKEFLEDRARQNRWRNALLWLVRVANPLPGTLANVMARWSRPPSPGTVAVESSNVDVQPLHNPTGASDAMEDGRQLKLRVIAGLGLAEYMLGDGYNANLATATAQQLPALTKFSAFQTIMIEQFWYPLLKRVLEVAIRAGELPNQVPEQDADGDPVYESDGVTPCIIDTLDAFDASYSPIANDTDMLALAKALAMAEDRGYIDHETAISEFGQDPMIVQKRIAQQEQKREADQAQGKEPLAPDDMETPGQDTEAA